QASDELIEVHRRMVFAHRQLRLGPPIHSELSAEELASALKAKAEFKEKFYKPSLARRRSMLHEVDTGHRLANDIPHDFITLFTMQTNSDWADDEVALREAMLGIRAAVESSTQAICHVVD